MAELNTKENETKEVVKEISATPFVLSEDQVCLLYTSDAADE